MVIGLFRKGVLLWSLAAGVILGAAAAHASNPYPRKGDSDPHDGVAAAKRMPIQGIDVSKYQLDIDWKAVKSAGTRFAFIKATEGGDLLDTRFRDNWTGAKEAGVPRGAYHFVFWCRPAKDQARWFIRNVPKDPDALPPVLDVEWNHLSSCRRPSADKARAKMREILRAFEAHYGKKPIIYTDITFHEDVLEGTTEFNDYPFWIRSVADLPQARYENRQWEFWQFTATGRVPGITGDVDRNAFYGGEKQFRDWIEGRYDIGARKPVNGNTGTRLAALNQPSAPVRAAPPAVREEREARPPASRPRAARTPARSAPARRDANRPIPPGIVPDITGSVSR